MLQVKRSSASVSVKPSLSSDDQTPRPGVPGPGDACFGVGLRDGGIGEVELRHRSRREEG